MRQARPPIKKKVASRACLECRKRKIKCYIEERVVGTENQDIKDISTKEGHDKVLQGTTTPVCKNCRCLNTECVFVKSRRGGKRIKGMKMSNNLLQKDIPHNVYNSNTDDGSNYYNLNKSISIPQNSSFAFDPKPAILQSIKPLTLLSELSQRSATGDVSPLINPPDPAELVFHQRDHKHNVSSNLNLLFQNTIPLAQGNIIQRVQKDGPEKQRTNLFNIQALDRKNSSSSIDERCDTSMKRDDDLETETTLTSFVDLKNKTSNSLFSDQELVKYELPSWDDIKISVEYYYRFKYWSQPFTIPIPTILKNISLNTESSILHVIVASLCTKMRSGFNPEEDFWLEKLAKYSDNLTLFGMLVYLSLLLKCPSYKHNLKKLANVLVKIWRLIDNNLCTNVIEKWKSERFLNITPRQEYELSITERLIWNFWLCRSIYFRFRSGYPFFRLSIIDSGFSLSLEFNDTQRSILLQNKGTTRPVVSKNNTSKTKLLQSMSFLETVADKISSHDMNKIIHPDTNVYQYLSDTMILKNDIEHMVILNLDILLCKVFLDFGMLLQHHDKVKPILPLLFDGNQESGQLGCTSSLIEAPSAFKIKDITYILTSVNQMDNSQWMSLLNLIGSLSSLMYLFEFEQPFMYSVKAVKHEEDFEVINITDRWLKYPDFMQVVACYLINLISNLIILSKMVFFEEKNGKIVATYMTLVAEKDSSYHNNFGSYCVTRKSIGLEKKIKLIDCQNVDINLMNNTILLKKLSTLFEFVKVILRGESDCIVKDTLVRMSKISHFLKTALKDIP